MDNRDDTKKVNWMLEGVSATLKHKCKEQALSENKTLKQFVIDTLSNAVGLNVVNHETGQGTIRRKSSGERWKKSAKGIRNKSS